MDIALFDFDGTITHQDTFTQFVKTAIPKRRQKWGRILLAPSIVGYRLGFVSPSNMRQKIIKVGFRGVPTRLIAALGRTHAQNYIPTVLRPEALERIQWHKARGDRVVVVSASLAIYLQPWCDLMDIELIAPELEDNAGRLTGRYLSDDCSGPMKAERVKAHVNISDYDTVYAYGDTAEDNELLALAHRQFFRWREITN